MGARGGQQGREDLASQLTLIVPHLQNLNCQTLLRDFKHEQKQKELRKEREQEDRRPSSSKKSAPKRVLELDDGSDSDDEPLSRKAVNAKDKGKGKEKNSTSTEAPRKKAKAVAPSERSPLTHSPELR